MRANATTTLLGRAALLVPYSAAHVAVYHSWMEDAGLREATASERLTLDEEREMQKEWASDDASVFCFLSLSLSFLFFPFLVSLPYRRTEAHGKNNNNIINDKKTKTTELTFIVCDASRPESPAVGDVNLFFRERSPFSEEDASTSYLHETAEVEVMIADEESRGRGIAREAVCLCLWWASVGASIAAAEKAAKAAASPSSAIPRLRLARVKIGRKNAASLALFESLGFVKTGGSDFFEEDHLELELFVQGEGEIEGEDQTTSTCLCPLLARVGEYAVVGEVERGEDAAAVEAVS